MSRYRVSDAATQCWKIQNPRRLAGIFIGNHSGITETGPQSRKPRSRESDVCALSLKLFFTVLNHQILPNIVRSFTKPSLIARNSDRLL
jgi:hypothetical protein